MLCATRSHPKLYPAQVDTDSRPEPVLARHTFVPRLCGERQRNRRARGGYLLDTVVKQKSSGWCRTCVYSNITPSELYDWLSTTATQL